MKNLFRIGLALSLSLLPVTAFADFSAFVISSSQYENFGNMPQTEIERRDIAALQRSGFDITEVRNANRNEVIAALFSLAERTQTDDVIVLSLTGHFLNFDDRTWYLPQDARRPNIFSLGQDSISVETLLRVLGESSAKTVLLLGTSTPGSEYRGRANFGIGALNVPENVTVADGDYVRVRAFFSEIVQNPNVSLSRSAQRTGVRLNGVLRSAINTSGQTWIDQVKESSEFGRGIEEQVAWQRAQAINTIEAYQAYISSFPRGQFVPNARQRIGALQPNPIQQAGSIEDALRLSVSQRKNIQRNLTDLGYELGEIDGIFGRSTRSAIVLWQERNQLPQTGFITQPQLGRLGQQSNQARAQRELEDRNFWRLTGSSGNVGGLNEYLRRYPNGVFSEQARANLERLNEEHLDRVRANAPRIEEQLRLNKVTITVVEFRLASKGLNPGNIDGVIDRNARRAIAQYQEILDMPVTGYLDRNLLATLLQTNSGR